MRWRRRRGRHWQGEPVAVIIARLDVRLHAWMPDGSLLLWPERPASAGEPLANLFTDTYHLPMTSFISDEVTPVQDVPEYGGGLTIGWGGSATWDRGGLALDPSSRVVIDLETHEPAASPASQVVQDRTPRTRTPAWDEYWAAMFDFATWADPLPPWEWTDELDAAHELIAVGTRRDPRAHGQCTRCGQLNPTSTQCE